MPDVRMIGFRMSPGWQGKVQTRAAPVARSVAIDIARDVRFNLRQGGNVETGELLRSVRVRKRSGGWGVYIGTDHWPMIEYGARPHVIKPVHKQALANKGGDFGPVSTILHPGNRAYRPVRRALFKKRRLRSLAGQTLRAGL